MKHCMAFAALALLSGCATGPINSDTAWTVQNGSACPKAGMTARDTDGDVTKCVEVDQ